jgi:hypothetical protein
MKTRRIRRANLLHGRDWTPKQAQIIASDSRTLCVNGGRRFGKSWTCAPAFLRRVHRRHEGHIRKVRAGDEKPWGGAGLPAKHARHVPPHVNAVVCAPMERHLEQCKNYIRSYYTGSFRRFLHPDLWLADAGRQTWLFYGGVATRIKFVVGKSISGVVSDENDVVWIDEGGMLDDAVFDALLPTLWNRSGELIVSGTPCMGTEHWYNRLQLQGLDPEHEYYEPDVVDPDPDVETIIGTSYEAYDPNVRAAAKKAAATLGAAYEAQWIKGDWRLPGVFIFDNWDAAVHVVDYDPATRKLAGYDKPLPPPKTIIGVIDFAYSTTKPGAAVVFHVWPHHPLDKGVTDKHFRRPLVIAIEDLEQAKEYTAGGWFHDLSQMKARTGLRYWLCDPSRPEMVTMCRRYKHRKPVIGLVEPAEKADKPGRMLHFKALLEHGEDYPPAFMVSSKCTTLPSQIANLKWKLDVRKNPTDTPQDDNDHCVDCCCFLMPRVGVGMIGLPKVA